MEDLLAIKNVVIAINPRAVTELNWTNRKWARVPASLMQVPWM